MRTELCVQFVMRAINKTIEAGVCGQKEKRQRKGKCVKKNALIILELSKADGRSMKLFHSDSEFLSKLAQQSRFGSTEHANRVQLAQLDAESIKQIHGRAIFI